MSLSLRKLKKKKKKMMNLHNTYLGGFNLLKSFSYSSSMLFEKLMLTSVEIKNFEEEKAKKL
jgi:hypothetical protein